MGTTEGILFIVGMLAVVILILTVKRKSELMINFILRAVMGTVAIFLVNSVLESKGLSVGIGINPFTVLTSGILGFPGIAVLYGINLYKSL